MYFADFDCLTGHLTGLELVPLQIRRFQLVPASGADIVRLQQTFDRESGQFDVHVRLKPDGRLIPSWAQAVCLEAQIDLPTLVYRTSWTALRAQGPIRRGEVL